MTLTEINYYTKQFAPIGIISVLVILIMVFGFRLLLLYAQIQSTPPPPSTQPVVSYTNPVFGKINPPRISGAKPSSQYSWVIDTLDGTPNVPEASSSANVYFIPQKTASFGFLSKIYAMAKAVGIDTEITQHQLNDKTAVFNDGKHNLSIDIRDFNFSYTYTLTEEDPITEDSGQGIESQLTSQAISFFTKMGRYPTELSQGKRNIIYLRFDPGTKQITPLESSEGANMAEVDFFPADIDGKPVVTSSYYNSPNYVLFLLGGRDFRIVRSYLNYFEKTLEGFGTYPLRTPQDAWVALQSGKGFVVSSSADSGEVKIQKVFLAYYESEEYQEYIQPVYVYLGEGRFVAYVPALAGEYLNP